MRVPLLAALPVCLLCCTSAAQTSTAPANGSPAVPASSSPAVPASSSPAAATNGSAGTSTAPAPAAMATYRNDTLHLSYSYPASYTDASSIVGTAIQAGMNHEAGEGGKDMSRCVTVPFSAMDSSGGAFSFVLLGRADAGCSKKAFTAAQLSDITQSEVQELTASGARPQFGQPSAFTTGGHAAELMRGTFALPTGQRLHAMVACVLLKPDVACWQFLSSAEDRVNTMSAFPVSLDGGQPVPVVPPAVLAKQ